MCNRKLKILLLGVRQKERENDKGPLIVGYEVYSFLKKDNEVTFVPSFRFNFDYFVSMFHILKQALFSRYYDIIHFNTFPPIYSPQIFLIFSKSTKVSNVHGIFKIEKNLKKRNFLEVLVKNITFQLFLRISDKIVVNSNHVLKILKKDYSLNDKKIVVIPNGVNINKNKMGEVKLKGKPSLLYSGVLAYHKGVDLIIESIIYLKKDFPSLHTYFIGNFINNEFKNEIFSMIKRNKLKRYITFYGQVPHQSTHNYYSNADICIFPSRYECFGMVNLEAMVCGKPIITSAYSGASELIKNREEAIIIKPSVREIKKAVVLLVRNKRLYKKISRKGRTLAMKYTWDKIVNKYQKEFNKCKR